MYWKIKKKCTVSKDSVFNLTNILPKNGIISRCYWSISLNISESYRNTFLVYTSNQKFLFRSWQATEYIFLSLFRIWLMFVSYVCKIPKIFSLWGLLVPVLPFAKLSLLPSFFDKIKLEFFFYKFNNNNKKYLNF